MFQYSLSSDEWLASKRRYVILLIVGLSIAFRALYFGEFYDSPIRYHYKAVDTDMEFFDLWAKDIAAGDWLTDKELHPLHEWQRKVAKMYFEKHPEAEAPYLNVIGDDGAVIDPAQAAWNKWGGGRSFHQEPLYPYLLAISYKLFGSDVRYVYAWQLAVGVMTNVLIYLVALRCFGDTAALISGLLAVFCGPLMFHEMTLLRTSLTVFTGVALAYISLAAAERFGPGRGLATGFAFGAATVLQSYYMLFFALVLIWLMVTLRNDRRKAAVGAVAMVAGFMLALSPVMARNAALGLPAMKLFGGGPISFIASNTADHDPWIPNNLSINFVPEIMGASNGDTLPAVIGTLRTHDSVFSFVDLMTRKFLAIWGWYEIPNNENYYYFKTHFMALRLTPVTFLIIWPFAVFGMALAARNMEKIAPPFFLALTITFTLVMHMALARYRAPLLAGLIPFAGFGVVKMMESSRRIIMGAAAITLVFAWYYLIPSRQALIEACDYSSTANTYYIPIIEQAKKDNDWRKVADTYLQWLRYDREFGLAEGVHNVEEYKMLTPLADTLKEYAAALRAVGETEKAGKMEIRAENALRAAKDLIK